MNAPAGHGTTLDTPPVQGDPTGAPAVHGAPADGHPETDRHSPTGLAAAHGHAYGSPTGLPAGRSAMPGIPAGRSTAAGVPAGGRDAPGVRAGDGGAADAPAGPGHGIPVAGHGVPAGVRAAGQGAGHGYGGPGPADGGGGAGGRRVAGAGRVTVSEFRLLGPVTVCDTAGGVIAPSGPKQRALLATLVLHAGQLLSVDRLVEELWGSAPPVNASNALQAHVARLRRLLPAPGHEWISTLPTGYLLAPGRASTDVARFTRLSGQGRAALPHDPGQAAQLLQRALSLWRGPALQDSRHGPLCTAEADRLEEQRLTALEALYEASLQCGRSTGITAGLERLSADHPLRERFYDLLMLALYRGGRQAEALGVYERARRHLITTLGIEPGPALRARLEAILNHCPTLTPPPHQTPPPSLHQHPSPTGRSHPSGPLHPSGPARSRGDRTDPMALPAPACAADPPALSPLTGPAASATSAGMTGPVASAGLTGPGASVGVPAGSPGGAGLVAPAAGAGCSDLTGSAGPTGSVDLTDLGGSAGFADPAGVAGSADLAGELAHLRARIEELARDQQDLLRRIQRDQAVH